MRRNGSASRTTYDLRDGRRITLIIEDPPTIDTEGEELPPTVREVRLAKVVPLRRATLDSEPPPPSPVRRAA